jgi:hypothetical protein
MQVRGARSILLASFLFFAGSARQTRSFLSLDSVFRRILHRCVYLCLRSYQRQSHSIPGGSENGASRNIPHWIGTDSEWICHTEHWSIIRYFWSRHWNWN